MSDVVVVGNGVAGYACAARLAERGTPVTMIGPGLPHDRPPLSKRSLLTGRVPLLADAAQLVERGVEVSDVQTLDPRDGGKFMFFSDPDGNHWAVQEIREKVGASLS